MEIHMIALFIVLFCSLANAKEPGIGVVVGDSTGFAVGDFNLFHNGQESYGFPRYGSAFNRLQIGNGIGISLADQDGLIIYDNLFLLAVEPGGGKIVFNTNSSVQSMYEWTPMLTVGFHVKLTLFDIIVLGKAGGALGDIDHNGLSPSVAGSYGYASYLDTIVGSFGYDYTYIGLSNCTSNVDYSLENIGARYERTKGIFEEDSFILLIRKKF